MIIRVYFMINDQELTKICADWSFWDRVPPASLRRQIALPPILSQDLALVIQGVRRGGKSTLLAQLPQHYGLRLAQCYYCNFEDPRLLNHLDHTLLSQILALAREQWSSDIPCYFFLDEIQNVKNWEKWLHTQLERPKNNFFILTGSNSSLLSGEFSTSLTGRTIALELFPFSFSEYKTLLPKKKLVDYLLSGGFPKAVTYTPAYELLQEYFDNIILRDVLRSVHARTPQALKQVIQMTFESCGSELSFRKIAASMGLTVDTVKSYLEAAEEAYLLFACPYFAFSEKKRLFRQKKYYPIDPGLRRAVIGAGGQDLGKSLELLVFLHLKKIYGQVFYWQERNQGEIDFVVLDGNTIIPYQVSWQGIAPRHEKALENFYQLFPNAKEAVFINSDNAAEFL
jgi:predicted AAA+ superfamily ATPase